MAKRAASSSSSAKGAGKGHPFGEDGGTLMATNADVSDPPGNAEERAAKHRRGEGQDAGTDSHTDAGSERGEINALEVDDEEIKQLSAWDLSAPSNCSETRPKACTLTCVTKSPRPSHSYSMRMTIRTVLPTTMTMAIR